MFNFAGITHVSTNPKGHAPGYNFGLVGSVPAIMMVLKPATTSDIMAGRAIEDFAGVLVAPHARKWETVQQILDFAAEHPEVKMCRSEGCACRQLWPAGSFNAYTEVKANA